MKWHSSVVLAAAFLVLASGADAQGVGLRAGVSADPDQFFGGLHYETRELLDRLRFRPNIEIGAGDDVTLTALNFEFSYRIPLDHAEWRLNVGAGPALNIYRRSRDTNPEGGFNIFVGVAHRQGLFSELKVGALHSPDLKFAVGYTFQR